MSEIVHNLKRLDALDINLVDSACRREFKLDNGRKGGVGEKRLFIRNIDSEDELEDFFEFDKTKFFFVKVSDLLKYLDDAKDEFCNPKQIYQNNIQKYYSEIYKETKEIDDEYITMRFRPKYDSQHRYYLDLEGSNSKKNPNRIAYSHLNNICLPRLTKIYFVKMEDKRGNRYIYMMPEYCETPTKLSKLNSRKGANANTISKKNDVAKQNSGVSNRDEQKQAQFREKLLEKTPYCAITRVGYDEILEACHIKPYAVCEENEQFDEYNGIIMTPTYHSLFDKGLISFTDDGKLLVSDLLTNRTRRQLNLKEYEQCLIVNKKETKYIKYHREKIFKSILSKVDDMVEKLSSKIE